MIDSLPPGAARRRPRAPVCGLFFGPGCGKSDGGAGGALSVVEVVAKSAVGVLVAQVAADAELVGAVLGVGLDGQTGGEIEGYGLPP